jgi:hypothetical protein
MWRGEFLGGPWSDQYQSGFALRQWAAEQWRSLGHVPQWNPEIFGGLPFVGAMHGDIFYPTALARLVLPIGLAMNLGFVVHYVLAGLLLYILLRQLGCSWTGSVTGGIGYQLSGVVGTYVAPGHDGKLFVTALLPLAFIALVMAFKRRRLEGYAVLALAVGLGVLSPHPQMLYYMLVAAGVFALYLAFGDVDSPPLKQATVNLGAALGAVVLGFGIGTIQILPFFEYIPFSPRADTYRGFEEAASYAIPWAHIPELFLSGFTGSTQEGTYWAGNPIKLHSEYLGLPIIAAAILGVVDPARRRLMICLSGISLLFLLIGLGSGTPFYRLWYDVMPYMKKVRAPGMALYLVGFVMALFAGFGVERLERGEGNRHVRVWLAVGGLVVALSAIGAVGGLARFFALGAEQPGAGPAAAVETAQGSVRFGALWSGVALAALAGVTMGWRRRLLPILAFAVLLPLIVGADLWRNSRPFWTFSPIQRELLGGDSITEYLQSRRDPYRVLQIPGAEPYPGNTLMGYGVPQLLGYHGNELHRFDELLGGKNQWRNLGGLNLWDLYGVEYLIMPSGIGVVENEPQLAELYGKTMSEIESSAGATIDLYARAESARMARLVPGALKAPDDQAIATVVDPRFDPDRVVIIDPDADLDPAPLDEMPEPLESAVTFESWEPGRMGLQIDPPASQAAYLVVGENWYPDWQATVDGEPATVLRGNVAMLVVMVPAGARKVDLAFDSSGYRLGKVITWIALAVTVAGLIGPAALRRRAAVA